MTPKRSFEEPTFEVFSTMQKQYETNARTPTHCAHGIPMSVPCPDCQKGTGHSPADIYLNAAKALATARVKEAQAFLRFKVRKDTTDGVARAQAIVDTNSELDVAEAMLEIARKGLTGT